MGNTCSGPPITNATAKSRRLLYRPKLPEPRHQQHKQKQKHHHLHSFTNNRLSLQTTFSQHPAISLLPQELWCLVFSFFDIQTRGIAAQVCWVFEIACLAKFGEVIKSIPKKCHCGKILIPIRFDLTHLCDACLCECRPPMEIFACTGTCNYDICAACYRDEIDYTKTIITDMAGGEVPLMPVRLRHHSAQYYDDLTTLEFYRRRREGNRRGTRHTLAIPHVSSCAPNSCENVLQLYPDPNSSRDTIVIGTDSRPHTSRAPNPISAMIQYRVSRQHGKFTVHGSRMEHYGFVSSTIAQQHLFSINHHGAIRVFDLTTTQPTGDIADIVQYSRSQNKKIKRAAYLHPSPRIATTAPDGATVQYHHDLFILDSSANISDTCTFSCDVAKFVPLQDGNVMIVALVDDSILLWDRRVPDTFDIRTGLVHNSRDTPPVPLPMRRLHRHVSLSAKTVMSSSSCEQSLSVFSGSCDCTGAKWMQRPIDPISGGELTAHDHISFPQLVRQHAYPESFVRLHHSRFVDMCSAPDSSPLVFATDNFDVVSWDLRNPSKGHVALLDMAYVWSPYYSRGAAMFDKIMLNCDATRLAVTVQCPAPMENQTFYGALSRSVVDRGLTGTFLLNHALTDATTPFSGATSGFRLDETCKLHCERTQEGNYKSTLAFSTDENVLGIGCSRPVTKHGLRSLGEGLVALTKACNALVDAERLSSRLHWGVFEDRHEFQQKARVRSWVKVKERMDKVQYVIVHDLAVLVGEMRELEEAEDDDDDARNKLRSRIEMFEKDLVMKCTVFDLLQPHVKDVELLITTWSTCPFIVVHR